MWLRKNLIFSHGLAGKRFKLKICQSVQNHFGSFVLTIQKRNYSLKIAPTTFDSELKLLS